MDRHESEGCLNKEGNLLARQKMQAFEYNVLRRLGRITHHGSVSDVRSLCSAAAQAYTARAFARSTPYYHLLVPQSTRVPIRLCVHPKGTVHRSVVVVASQREMCTSVLAVRQAAGKRFEERGMTAQVHQSLRLHVEPISRPRARQKGNRTSLVGVNSRGKLILHTLLRNRRDLALVVDAERCK